MLGYKLAIYISFRINKNIIKEMKGNIFISCGTCKQISFIKYLYNGQNTLLGQDKCTLNCSYS